jgi:hypothetical protein
MVDLPEQGNANVRAPNYYIASTRAECWHCGRSTRVLALALPPTHETLDVDTREIGDWRPAGAHAIIFYVAQLPDTVQNRLRDLSSQFCMGYSDITSNSYWVNHCQHCAALLDDHELHCEPSGAFMPGSESTAANIQLLPIGEAFQAVAAGFALEPEFFQSMSKA